MARTPKVANPTDLSDFFTKRTSRITAQSAAKVIKEIGYAAWQFSDGKQPAPNYLRWNQRKIDVSRQSRQADLFQQEQTMGELESELEAGRELPLEGTDWKNHRPNPPTFSPDEYLRALEAYRVSPTIRSVLAATGWSRPTASKIIYEGYPDYGYVALQERYRRFVEDSVAENLTKDRAVMDQIATEAREIQVGSLRLVRQALQAGCAAVFDDEGRVRPRDLKDLWDVFERAGRFFAFAKGGADSRVELAIPGGVLDEAAMLANLIDAGVLEAAAIDVTPLTAPEKPARRKRLGAGK